MIISISIISIYQYISLAPKKVVAIIPEYSGNANEFNYLVTDNLSYWISKVVQITRSNFILFNKINNSLPHLGFRDKLYLNWHHHLG